MILLACIVMLTTFNSASSINPLCSFVAATNIEIISLHYNSHAWSCDTDGNPVSNPCGWNGIYCDENDNVVELIQYWNDTLSGTLPSELSTLNLINLQISGRYQHIPLSGSIPSEYCQFNSMSHLQLSKSSINGSIPDCFTSPQLQFVELNHNLLSNTIPTGLGNSRSISTLRLDSNYLTGVVPSELCMNTVLKTLDFNNNTGLTCYEDCLRTVYWVDSGDIDACGNSGHIMIEFLSYTFGAVGFSILCTAFRKILEYFEKNKKKEKQTPNTCTTGEQAYSETTDESPTSGPDAGSGVKLQDMNRQRASLTIEGKDLIETMKIYSKSDINESDSRASLLVEQEKNEGRVEDRHDGLGHDGPGTEKFPTHQNADVDDKILSIELQKSEMKRNQRNERTLASKARRMLVQYRILFMSLFKLLLVGILTLILETDWQYCPNDLVERGSSGSDVVETCECQIQDGGLCGTLCEADVDGIATLTADCACTYWKAFNMGPMLMHVLHFIIQCVVLYLYGDYNPQGKQLYIIYYGTWEDIWHHLIIDIPQSCFALFEVLTTVYVWLGVGVYQKVYCTAYLPLSSLIYPILMTVTEFTRLNIFAATIYWIYRRSTSKSYVSLVETSILHYNDSYVKGTPVEDAQLRATMNKYVETRQQSNQSFLSTEEIECSTLTYVSQFLYTLVICCGFDWFIMYVSVSFIQALVLTTRLVLYVPMFGWNMLLGKPRYKL